MRRALTLVVAVALVVGGVVIGWRSLDGPEPAAAPVPSRTFDVASPTPDPTRTAEVAAIPDDPPSSTSSGASTHSRTSTHTGASSPTTPTSAATPTSTGTGEVDQVEMSPEGMAADRIYVPSLGIYASLTDVSFSGGSLTIPSQPWRVGIDVGSAPLESRVGTTLLAGHVDLSGTPGALVRLSKAEPGALVYVTDEQGKRSAFVTTGLKSYSKVALPRSIFDVEGTRQLAVVTCGGPIMEQGGERHYRDNIVLTASPA